MNSNQKITEEKETHMNKLNSSLVTLCGLFLLIGAIALVSPPASRGDSMRDVKVVNTTSEPVPTIAQGTTKVAGDVGINPSSNVIKLDSSANIVKVENSASPLLLHDVSVASVRQPVVHRGAKALPAGQFEISQPFVDVPPGKRWVIEYINLEVNAPGDYGASVFLDAPFGPDLIRYNLLTTHNDPPLGILLSQQLKIYAGAGQTQLTFRRNPGTGGVPETIFNFVFSGYLESIE